MGLESRIGNFFGTIRTIGHDYFAEAFGKKVSSEASLIRLKQFAQYERESEQLSPEQLLREQKRLEKQSQRWETISMGLGYGTALVSFGVGSLLLDINPNSLEMWLQGLSAGSAAGAITSLGAYYRWWNIDGKRKILQREISQ